MSLFLVVALLAASPFEGATKVETFAIKSYYAYAPGVRARPDIVCLVQKGKTLADYDFDDKGKVIGTFTVHELKVFRQSDRVTRIDFQRVGPEGDWTLQDDYRFSAQGGTRLTRDIQSEGAPDQAGHFTFRWVKGRWAPKAAHNDIDAQTPKYQSPDRVPFMASIKAGGIKACPLPSKRV